jgi:hypothetical protein
MGMQKYGVRSRTLPLAMYREVAAHVMQVAGVEVELWPQRSPSFDYSQSQIDSLWIEYPEGLDAASQSQVQQILAYYGDRYGAWETLSPDRQV